MDCSLVIYARLSAHVKRAFNYIYTTCVLYLSRVQSPDGNYCICDEEQINA